MTRFEREGSPTERNTPPIPDNNRFFIGAGSEFEVETVLIEEGSISRDEAHPFDEILVLLESEVDLELDSGVEALVL